MNWSTKVGLVCLSVPMLGACGGGDTAPPVPDGLVTVMRSVSNTTFDGNVQIKTNTSATVISEIVNSGIAVRSIKCASLSPAPPPPGTVTAQVQQEVILLEMSASDAEKAKASFRFVVFGPAEAARVSGGFSAC